MILSNVQIHRAIDAGRIVIRPEPLPRDPAERGSPYDTHSVDVSLGPILSQIQNVQMSFDLHRPGTSQANLTNTLRAVSRHLDLTALRSYTLDPNTFILGHTEQWLELPIPAEGEICLSARVEGKSSRARTGLIVHFTAPTMHPGFRGNITLEIINLGPIPFTLRVGMPIAQLLFEEVRGIPLLKTSQFQDQTTPEGKS
jgi:dCTP deaminase